MKLTERQLRSVIREVLKESIFNQAGKKLKSMAKSALYTDYEQIIDNIVSRGEFIDNEGDLYLIEKSLVDSSNLNINENEIFSDDSGNLFIIAMCESGKTVMGTRNLVSKEYIHKNIKSEFEKLCNKNNIAY